MLEFMHMFNVYALHTDIALAYFYLSQSTGKLVIFLLNWNVNVVCSFYQGKLVSIFCKKGPKRAFSIDFQY